jgi:nucleotide-binding universal stress UspA family protein
VLIASDGRPVPRRVIDLAVELATSGQKRKASVHVFSVARIYGTSLGMPMPGLLPTRQEWDAQRELVAQAVKALKGRGLRAEGHVVATRNATKQILKTAEKYYCDVIVMAADPPRHGLVSDFMWTQEAYRVERRSPIPVYLLEQRRAQTA